MTSPTIAERYRAATTFPEFLETVEKNRDLWIGVANRVRLESEDIAQLDNIPGTWHFAVLSEDWCGDAVNIVPVVDRLVDALPNADLRLFPRDQNLDLMDAHLTRGGRAIPVVIIYDEHFVERAWWGPRPAELQEWYWTKGQEFESSSDRYRELRAWYARDRGRTIVREITELLRGVAVSDLPIRLPA